MIIFASLLIAIATADNEPKLRDLVRIGENLPLFDTLDAAVSAEYSRQFEGNDEVVSAPHEPFRNDTPSIARLNSNYSDVLIESDIRVNKQVLEDMLDDLINVGDKRKRRRRQAYKLIDADKRGISVDDLARRSPIRIPSGSLYKRKAILTSINFYRRETCIKFRPRKRERQYVYFVGHDEGCWSTVGRDISQGQQWISIGNGCEPFGISSHEIAHALGLFHEQSRFDRDKFIRIIASRVPRGLMYNFAKIGPRQLKTYGVPYEIGSVMHYGPTEFSTNYNVPSMVARNPSLQQTMGSLSGPTFLDVKLLNDHYRCGRRCKRKIKCFHGGYQNPNRCSMCKCPSGYSGPRCKSIERPTIRGCSGIIRVTAKSRQFRLRIRASRRKHFRQCNYHLRSPRNTRIVILIKSLQRVYCEPGCWRQAVEFKMGKDKRPTGMRFCCSRYARRRMVSGNNEVPMSLFTQSGAPQVVFTYHYIRHHRRNGINETTSDEKFEFPEDENDGVKVSNILPEDEKDVSYEPEISHDEENFTADIMSQTTNATASDEKKVEMEAEKEEMEADGDEPYSDVDTSHHIDPLDLADDEQVKESISYDVPIDTDSFFSQSPLNNPYILSQVRNGDPREFKRKI